MYSIICGFHLSFLFLEFKDMPSHQPRQRRRKRRAKCKRKKTGFKRAISTLCKMNAKDRSEAIRYSNDQFIRDFCAEIRRLKYKKLEPKQLNTVKKHKTTLRRLSNPRISVAMKRKTLTQKGGIIGAILSSLVIPAIIKAATG